MDLQAFPKICLKREPGGAMGEPGGARGTDAFPETLPFSSGVSASGAIKV